METLLRPGIKKILNIFYNQKNEKIHLRKLARETNMHGQNISRYLHELEKANILLSDHQGNLKQFSLRKNPDVYTLFTIFDIERIKNLPLLRRNAIETYIKSLPVPPIFAILFGSTAKGTYANESDIDILIITQSRMAVEQAEKETEALTAIKVSTFQMTFKEFKRELKLKDDKVVQSALNTGFPILNHVYYYEVLSNERI